MCHAMPVEIVELKTDQTATVNLGGIKKEISIALVENINVGDYVIIHVGFAIAKLNEDEAKKTLSLFSEMQALHSEEIKERLT